MADNPPNDRRRLVREALDSSEGLSRLELARLLDGLNAVDPQARAEVEAQLSKDERRLGAGETRDRRSQSDGAADAYGFVGKQISHYKIKEVLGGGGMGLVYRAYDLRLERDVALKFLPPHQNVDPNAQERFAREARAASQLDHPNICTVYEIDRTEEGQTFIAMAFYEGRTLKKIISDGPMPVRRALDLVIETAEGLANAHDHGIVHRDVKPANLFVTKSGTLKILDFGLAKIADTTLTKSGLAIGTVAYMSPEQARGDKIDARTDVWSIGAVLYEMIAGRRPFEGDYDLAVLFSIANDEPRRLTPDEAPPSVASIVDRCLQKNPNQRYQSCADLLAALKSARRQLGASTEKPAESSVRRAYARWTAVAAAGAIIFAVLLTVSPDAANPRQWIQSVTGQTGEVRQYIAIIPLRNVSGDEQDRRFCDGLVQIIASKLTQILPRESFSVLPMTDVMSSGVSSAEHARGALGATLVITGSYQRLEDDVQVTLNLVDTKRRVQLDSKILNESLTNLSDFQTAIVGEVLGMLGAQPTSGYEGVIRAVGTASLDAFDYYSTGLGYLRSREADDVDSAIELFKSALERDDAFALGYAGLGEAYWRKYELTRDTRWVDPAIESCERALELDDGLAHVHVVLGIVQAGTGKFAQAFSSFERALEIDPEDPRAHRALARAYRDLGALEDPEINYEKAEYHYRQAIALDPQYFGTYNALGIFFLSGPRQIDSAIDEFKKGLTLAPRNASLYLNLGAAYAAQNRRAEAIEAWEQSVAIEPLEQTYMNLGTFYFQDGQYANAATAYEQALELNDAWYRIWGYLAEARWWSGRHEAAETAYRKAAELAEKARDVNQRDALLIVELASYYAGLNRNGEAESAVEEALSLAPENGAVLATAGTVLEKLGDRRRAVRLINEALKRGYPEVYIETSPSLNDLRNDPRFARFHESNSPSI